MTTKAIRRNYLCSTINKYEQKCCERGALTTTMILEDCLLSVRDVRVSRTRLAAIDRCFRQSIRFSLVRTRCLGHVIIMVDATR